MECYIFQFQEKWSQENINCQNFERLKAIELVYSLRIQTLLVTNKLPIDINVLGDYF